MSDPELGGRQDETDKSVEVLRQLAMRGVQLDKSAVRRIIAGEITPDIDYYVPLASNATNSGSEAVVTALLDERSTGSLAQDAFRDAQSLPGAFL